MLLLVSFPNDVFPAALNYANYAAVLNTLVLHAHLYCDLCEAFAVVFYPSLASLT